MVSTKQRSAEAEIMDKFDFQGQELVSVLQEIDRVNTSLGGHRVTIKAIKQLLKSKPEKTNWRIADLGCGSGASLRVINRWAIKQGLNLQLVGIDANPHIIKIARNLSSSHSQITFECVDVFSEDFKQLEFDIIFSSLTFHHFKNQAIIHLLQHLETQVKYGIIINDLHRHRLAYYLFKWYAHWFMQSKVAKHDGLISVLRGFKSADFAYFSTYLKASTHLKWCWAFRYQYIIQLHG